MVALSRQVFSNPILAKFMSDPNWGEAWIVDEYLEALDAYERYPEIDEDSDLRLSTYLRVSRCGTTVEDVVFARSVFLLFATPQDNAGASE